MDTFGESGSADDLLQKYGLTVENIIEKTNELLKIK
jgi:transketolase